MNTTIDLAATRATASATPRGVAGSRAENALVRIVKRFPWVIVGGVLGAVLGILLSIGPSTYAATASLRVTEPSLDSTRLKQVAQTVERTATSAGVVEAAAKERGIDADDLAARLTAEWQTDTDVVDVTVRGSDPAEVVDDAQAVVDSLTGYYGQQTSSQIEAMRREGNRLLSTGRLSDPEAEAARRSAVGSALASRQEAAASGSTTVSVLASGQDAVETGVSLPMGTVFGGFVGGALMAAAALVVPVRRRRVRTLSDVESFVGAPTATSALGPAEVAGLMLQSERQDLAVVAMGGAEQAAAEFGGELVTMLGSHGRQAAVVNAVEDPSGQLKKTSASHRAAANGQPPSSHALGVAARASAKNRLGVQALVMVTTATRTPLNLLAGQPQVLAVVVVPRGKYTTAAISDLVTQLRHSDPVVVLTP